MRKLIALLILAIMLAPTFAQEIEIETETPDNNTDVVVSSERKSLFRGMVVAGFNASQIDGDRMGGYNKFGAHAGVGVLIALPHDLSFGLEILYSMKGSKVSPAQVKQNPFWVGRKIELDYIDLPITLNYTVKKRVMLSGGVIGNVLIRQKTDAGTFTSSDLRRFGLEGTLGAYYIHKGKLGAGIRWSYSLLPLDQNLYNTQSNLFDRRLRNNVLSVRVFYLI